MEKETMKQQLSDFRFQSVIASGAKQSQIIEITKRNPSLCVRLLRDFVPRNDRREIQLLTRIFLLFLLLALYSLLVPAVHAATVDDIVNDIQKKFAGIHDMKGAFSQTSYLKDLEKTEIYAGAFYIKKPSGIMWEYKAPRDEKVIITGTDTWIYKKSQKQAVKTRFSKEAYSQVPIALLNNLENLRADFDITLMDQGTLNLKPKHQMGFIQEIHLKTDSKNFPVKMLEIFDTYGNKITIALTGIKTNSGLDDSLFTFTPPPGVEVYDMGQ